MSELGDYRKSRFYQEARQDGLNEARAKRRLLAVAEGKAEMLRQIIHRMASKGYDARQISDVFEVDIKIVKKILQSKSP